MFYELIYTRCRQGIDITRKGQPVSGDGYKVYSCTPAITDEGVVDLQLLANVAQTKQSYTDPSFMDDAYLYYVPDTGESFFINFYPVPFDAKAQGDYSHRPGNFVNHALIGKFSRFYPYELFRDDSIWNARTKGEAFYYENPPKDMDARSDITDLPGHYGFDEIGAFIADGRKEALEKAVSFLVAQYTEEPEKRKYLVIRDDSSKNIELWIAAIECAFSPKIASSIPFATRMDKFVSINRYTIKNGLYQTQMNLQDPNHKQRYRAMIVGVDERDKTNVSAARPLANSPFVLLDGKQKQAMFDSDISNSYYQIITKFDNEHKRFCREFLQTFDILKPDTDIYGLYDIFTVLLNKPSMPNARTLADKLDKLNKYKAAKTGIYIEIYNRVNKDMSRFLQEDFSCALNIINWLLNASKITGDTGASQRLTKIICDVFTDLVFHKTDNTAKSSYWAQIRRTEFAKSVAGVITNMEIIKNNISNLKSPADIVTFVLIYLESASLIGNIEQQEVTRVVKYGIEICYNNDDKKSLHEIVSALSQYKGIKSREFLFALVKAKSDDKKKYSEFIIEYIISYDAAIIASDNSVLEFCKKLSDEGLEHLIISVLKKRVNMLNSLSDMELFVKTIKNAAFIGDEVMAKVFELIDSKVSIGISADSASPLAELLQTQKPKGAVCKNSAHLFALKIISDNRRAQSLIDTFKDLTSQGFPRITDINYIINLIEHLLKAKLSMEEQQYILDVLFRAPKEYFTTYVKKLLPFAAKQQDKWNALFSYISDSKNEQVYNAASEDIVQALVDSKQSEKSLTALGSLLKDESTQKYFDDARGKALEIISSQKPKSGIGKFFGSFLSSGDDKTSTDKKEKK